MSSYGDDTPMKETPMTAPKPSRGGGKMSEKQKADLRRHMEKHKKAGMSASEMKSHRMKMMVRMRRGLSVGKAHKDIVGSK